MVRGRATSEVENMVINDHEKNLKTSKLPMKWYKHSKNRKRGLYHISFMVVKSKNEK